MNMRGPLRWLSRALLTVGAIWLLLAVLTAVAGWRVLGLDHELAWLAPLLPLTLGLLCWGVGAACRALAGWTATANPRLGARIRRRLAQADHAAQALDRLNE